MRKCVNNTPHLSLCVNYVIVWFSFLFILFFFIIFIHFSNNDNPWIFFSLALSKIKFKLNVFCCCCCCKIIMMMNGDHQLSLCEYRKKPFFPHVWFVCVCNDDDNVWFYLVFVWFVSLMNLIDFYDCHAVIHTHTHFSDS